MTTPPMPENLRHFKTGAPSGFGVLKNPSKEVASKAKQLLSNKMGEEFQFEIGGVNYFARVEPHYHPPGYIGGPNGWHKGVTVYVNKKPKTEISNPKTEIESKTLYTEALPVLKQEKPKFDFLSELDKIVKRLMG